MRREKDLFDYSTLLKPICGLLTKHRHKELVLWEESFCKGGYKYPNRHDFYYKCKICGWVYFNHHVSKEDLEHVKEVDKRGNKDE